MISRFYQSLFCGLCNGIYYSAFLHFYTHKVLTKQNVVHAHTIYYNKAIYYNKYTILNAVCKAYIGWPIQHVT